MSQINCITYKEEELSTFCEYLKGHFETVTRNNLNKRNIYKIIGENIDACVFGVSSVAFLTTTGKVCRACLNEPLRNQADDAKFDAQPEKKRNTVTAPPLRISEVSSSLPSSRRNASLLPRDSLDILNAFRTSRIGGNSSGNISMFDSMRDSVFPLISEHVRSRNRRNIEVPENLIAEVRGILQGRSRIAIIRELTRSNLDVNVAVNNLLNMEEDLDVNDDQIDEEDELDNNFSDEPIQILNTEDLPTETIERPITPPPPTIEKPVSSIVKEYTSTEMAISNVEWWPVKNNVKFTQIAAMHSDLVALDSNGCLYQWPWSSNEPLDFSNFEGERGIHSHKKIQHMECKNERVKLIASSLSRMTVVLESNKVATWMDSALWNVSQLESVNYINEECKTIPITSIKCCDIYTTALLQNGTVWWWGVLPFQQRKVVKPTSSSDSPKKESTKKKKIVVGSLVTSQCSILYNVGTLAYFYGNNTLKMGRLVEAITTMRSSAKFEVLDSTKHQEETSKLSKKRKFRSRKRTREALQTSYIEEEWQLSEVIFLNEKSNNGGIVVKIDRENVLVNFGSSRAFDSKLKSKNILKETDSLKNCRIINIKDLKVIKKVPNRTNLIPHIQILPKRIRAHKYATICAHDCSNKGIHILLNAKNTPKFSIEYFSPGSKSTDAQSGQISGYFCDIWKNPDFLIQDMTVAQNCAVVKTKTYGSIVLKRDYADNYSLAPFPSLPFIEHIFINKRNSNFSENLIVITACNPIPCSVASNNSFTLEAGFSRMSNSFYINQNVIHYLAFMAHVFESPFCNEENINCVLEEIITLLSGDKEEVVKLLCHRDFNGLTPFLFALSLRSYRAALKIYQMINLYRSDISFISRAIFPEDLPYYMNPLYILSTNDCCSYLWTGNSHIEQDVYECKTCGITLTYCCCTECAFTCHRGHDCVLKTCSPTAFCDCWERCSCKSLTTGDQSSRKDLFRSLILESDLLTQMGTGSDHIMLFIIRTLARQNDEHKFKNNQSQIDKQDLEQKGSLLKKISQRSFTIGHPIKHIKQPVKFAEFALKLLLSIKESVKSLFTSYTTPQDTFTPEQIVGQPYLSSSGLLLPPHSCGKMFDCFLYNLFTRCNKGFSKTLRQTLADNFPEDVSSFKSNQTCEVLTNFIRSCARIYVLVTSLMSPYLLSEARKANSAKADQFKILYRLAYFFKRFPVTSIIEVSKMSLSVVSPVISGCVLQKMSVFYLFQTMGEVNDFVSKFFNPLQTSDESSTKDALQNEQANLRDIAYLALDDDDGNYEDNIYDDIETEEGINTDEDTEFELYSDDGLDFEGDDGDEDDDDDNDDGNDDGDFDDLPPEAESMLDYPEDEIDEGPVITVEDGTPVNETIIPEERQPSPIVADDVNTDNENNLNISNPNDESITEVQQNNEPVFTRRYQIVSFNDNRNRWNGGSGSLLPQHQWAVRGNTFLENSSRREPLPTLRAVNSDLVMTDGQTTSDLTAQSGLARSYSILIRLVADIITDYLDEGYKCEDTQEFIKKYYGKVFLWMYDIMDTTEARLRFGISSLNNLVPSLQPGRWDYDVTYGTNNESTFQNIDRQRRRQFTDRGPSSVDRRNRNDFLTHILSLTRSHENEHFGVLPWLDVATLKHVAYIFDGFIYFVNATNNKFNLKSNIFFDSPLEDSNDLRKKSRVFFTRTKSTLSFGYMIPDYLTSPINESLPLAILPTLLKPTSTKNELFSIKEPIMEENTVMPQTYSFQPNIAQSPAETTILLDKIFNSGVTSFIVRWKNLVDIFSHIFIENVGCEEHSIFKETCQFSAKESNFKAQVEKIKIKTNGEINFEYMERKQDKVIISAFKILNTFFKKKSISVKNGICPFSRVKASFKGELGEGLGVTRNFLHVISEAIINSEKLPDISSTMDSSNSNQKNSHLTLPASTASSSGAGDAPFYLYSANQNSVGDQSLNHIVDRLRRIDSAGQSRRSRVLDRIERAEDLIRDSGNYYVLPDGTISLSDAVMREICQPSPTQAEAIKEKISRLYPGEFEDIIYDGLSQLRPDVLSQCLKDDVLFRSKVDSILTLFQEIKDKNAQLTVEDGENVRDGPSIFPPDSALFFQPGKPGFYFPFNAQKTSLRLSAFKNVGRIIGINLFLHEISPILLCRSVIKFLLGRELSFHDFAFYDPLQYESLRLLLVEAFDLKESCPADHHLHDLYFSIDVLGPKNIPHCVDLIKDGAQIPVTLSNVFEYVQKYAEYYMLTRVKSELTAMKEGFNEVIHPSALQNLNAEDFRLLLNGTMEISTPVLRSIVTFSEETGECSKEKLKQYQEWFWQVFDDLTNLQKSELLLFWTSAPQISVMEHSHKPSIVVKSPSPNLPTSNTCILRLYVPLYPSKKVLKSKILMAIKTKTFGFV